MGSTEQINRSKQEAMDVPLCVWFPPNREVIDRLQMRKRQRKATYDKLYSCDGKCNSSRPAEACEETSGQITYREQAK